MHSIAYQSRDKPQSQFPSTWWILSIKLRLSGLVENIFTLWAMSPAPVFYTQQKYELKAILELSSACPECFTGKDIF